MRNNNDNNIKVKMLGMMLSAFFFGVLLLFDRITASATIVNITFGEEAIAVGQEETFKVPVNIKADGNIGYYEVQIKYDANRMQYVSGADAEDNGIITLRGEGWGGEISYGNIEFKAISGGSAGMKVMEASIYNNDEENSLYEPEFLPELNIEINGDENDYLPFFEQVKIDDRIQTTLDTYGIKTDAPIVGSISKGSERLYVVDMTDYTPDLQIWNYTLVTDLFMGQNMTYISDSARNVRVIPVMNAKGAYSIYAIDTQTNEVYPIQIATEGGIDGKKYYIMSLEACSSLPEEMTIAERESDTIFYGIDVNGIGDYYRYTSDGKLETWANSIKNEKKQEFISVLKVILVILGSGVVIALITLLIVKRRGVANKIKEQFVYVKDGVVDRKQYFFVISQLTSREIKRKYARSYLGIIWSVLNPLLHMIVMSLIFSYMFQRSIDKFPLYYLTGHLFYDFFTGATNHSISALVDNKNLLLKAKLPKQTFVLSRVYTALVNLGYTIIPYVLMLIVFRTKPSWTMLLLPFDLVLALLFTTGISYILAILYVFFADIKYLYGVFTTILMYLSAVFYPVDRLPAVVQKVVGLNPVYLSIYIAREAVVYNRIPHYSAWIKLAVAAVLSFGIGYWIFKKKQNDVMQKV